MLLKAMAITVVGVLMGLLSNYLRGSPVDLSKPYVQSFRAQRLDPASAQKWLGTALFLDVRSGKAYESGHIPGAFPVSLDIVHQDRSLCAQLGSALKSLTVIVYCDPRCNKADKIASMLLQEGVVRVYVLEGGLPVWRDSGYPTEKGTRGSATSSSEAEDEEQ